MNQAMLYEFPQGDPYSGPAYGDKHKSKGLGMILGVVASVATMGAAAPMLASGVLGSQIAGGAMMAGGVLSGVGVVAGNKKLMKIGGVLSLAGGVGNLAASGLGIGQGVGSQAVSRFGTNFMESANSLGVGDLYSAEAISAGKAASGLGAETAAGGVGGAGGLGTETAAGGAGGQTLDLAKSELAASGGQGSGIVGSQLGDMPMSSGGPQVGATQSTAAGGQQALQGVAKETSTLDKALEFARKNPEVTKIGAGMLEKAMAAGENDDQVSALIDRYKAETNLLTTKDDIEKYKLANAGKQVLMISADDPDLDAKVKQATAGNIPVAFIPAIGKNYTPVSKNFTPVARNATYSQPTA